MQKLRFPVDFVGITNGYSSSHQAIDLGWHNNQHEPIYACADGKVSKIWEDKDFGGGLTVTIEYINGFKSDFKHLSKSLVKKGQKVKQGEQVAVMGNSGWASGGTHLHYNCYKNGYRVNPLEYTYLYPGQEVSSKDKDKVLVYVEEKENKFKIGDKVVINGYLYKSSNASEPSGKVKNRETTITRIAEGTQHPYNTKGDLGWMDEESIEFADNYVTYTVKKGDTLIGIAEKYDTTWQKIYNDNIQTIGSNPNRIKPNQVLIIKD